MKKLILSLALFLAVISSSFAGFFDHRVFEVKFDTDVVVAQNSFDVLDYLVPDLTIDFSKIAKEMPKNGLNLTAKAFPELDVTFDLTHGLHFGVQAGVQVYASAGISREPFDILGKSLDFSKYADNTLKIELPDTYVDVFASVSLNVGWNGKKIAWLLTPSVFTAVAHLKNDNSFLELYNKDDGSFGYNLDAKGNLFTPVMLPEGFNFAQFDVSSLNNIGSGIGFDMGVSFKYNLSRNLSVIGSARVPIVPSKLSYGAGVEFTSSYDSSISKLLGGDAGSPEFENHTEASKELDSPYTINRPMKFGVNLDIHPFKNWLILYGGAALCFEHPFAQDSSEQGFYIDYNLAARFSLINILSLQLSTGRTDKIFQNKLVLGLNFRLVEVDAGVALSATSLLKSFTAAGVGAFVTVCVGF